MTKTRQERFRTFFRNVKHHLLYVLKRKERPMEAFEGVRNDARKLNRALHEEEGEREVAERAHKLVKKGRRRYNEKKYHEAEGFFRSAIETYNKNVWAHTFLGHALYQQGRHDEALEAWKTADRIDPDSEAASKARKKIQLIERRASSAVTELEQRLRGE